jgi:hypothetical protein
VKRKRYDLKLEFGITDRRLTILREIHKSPCVTTSQKGINRACRGIIIGTGLVVTQGELEFLLQMGYIEGDLYALSKGLRLTPKGKEVANAYIKRRKELGKRRARKVDSKSLGGRPKASKNIPVKIQ